MLACCDKLFKYLSPRSDDKIVSYIAWVDQYGRDVVRRFRGRRRRRTYVGAREQYSADDHDHEKFNAWVL